MEALSYGRTGLVVSRLCFGAGHLGKLTDSAGARLLLYAFDKGTTFWDTAIAYDSHRHVGAALKEISRADVVIASKTGAQTYQDGMRDVQRALVEMGTDYVDIMLLHGVRDVADFDARRGCLEALLEAQRHGSVRAVGLSSHIHTGSILDVAEEDSRIQALLTAGNPEALGLAIQDLEEHLQRVEHIAALGKGVSLMKVLAAGQRPERAAEWLAWAFALPGIHAVNVGLTSRAQIDLAVAAASKKVNTPTASMGE